MPNPWRNAHLRRHSHSQVVRTAAGVFPVLALTLPGDGLNCVLSGVLRGAGRQALGACLNLVTYWWVGRVASERGSLLIALRLSRWSRLDCSN